MGGTSLQGRLLRTNLVSAIQSSEWLRLGRLNLFYQLDVHSIGENCFMNFNFIVLNTCEVRIGDRCLFGPNVSL